MKVAFKVKAKNGVLQEFIDKKGWSQSEFARQLGCSIGCVGHWFNMISYPKTQELMTRLCKLVGTTEDQIFPQIFKDKDFLMLKKNITFYKQVDPERLMNGEGLTAIEAPTGETDHTMIDNLWKILDDLSFREKQILIRKYGLDGNPPETLEAIGNALMISRTRVGQIMNHAMRKLRNPIYLNKFSEEN